MKMAKRILAGTIITGSFALQGTHLEAQKATSASTSSSETIRAFKVNFADTDLKNLRRRILATKWPKRETVSDESQGVQLATMRKLAEYWATDYNWRKAEAKLNALPQFMTNIDGLDIHFIHVRSKEPNALPIIITHGWPGSVFEMLKVIDPLTNPTANGGKSEDAFDVVIPSMPGYGFSEQPNTTGWGTKRMARAWDVLMKRLGYQHYVAQGGDWGNAVAEEMATQRPAGLLAIHTNMPAAVPPEIDKPLFLGEPLSTAGFSEEEKQACDQLSFFYKKGLGYAQEMANRPQTLYGIEDSPIGLAAWILDHDARSYKLIARVFDGQTEGLSKDDILDNITLYWLTNTAVSSARLYWEYKGGFFNAKNLSFPVAVSVFPDEIYAAPRTWAVKAFPKLIYYNRLEKGGHFAAWEQPQAYSNELRAAFKSIRTSK